MQRLLSSREARWTEKQKELQRERVKAKHEKGKRVQIYQDKLLSKCKSWGGPCVSVEELESAVQSHPDRAEAMVRTELTYFRQCHRADMLLRPELYKVNGIGHDERMENLIILLSDMDNFATESHDVQLPTNREALNVISNSASAPPAAQEPENEAEINQLYVTLWDERGVKTWYLGYCVSCGNGTIIVDHLHRTRKKNDTQWKYPDVPDTSEVTSDQLFAIRPVGDWNLRSSRNVFFKLANACMIKSEVNSLE